MLLTLMIVDNSEGNKCCNHPVMKKILLLFFLFCDHWSFGQLDFKNSNVGRVMDLADLDGRSLLKKYDPEVTGSPFINDDWVSAKLTLSRGKEIGPLPIKLNIESNELYFLDSAGKEMIAADGLVKKVDCIDYYTKDSTRYIFKSGYPPIEAQKENYFYQVLTEGRIELLARKFKYIRSERNDLSGDVSKSFVDGIVVLYVYAYGMIQPLKSNKDFIATLWDENKQQEMNKYISDNKINFKSTSDLIKLFNYYDGIK
jgi:hypothetical protein